MLAAVILSGGPSSRMGSPKALLPYQGRPFLEHLLEIISRPEIGARRVVLGADAESIAKAVPLKANEMIINAQWEKGQLSSIQAAVRKLPAGTDGMLVFLIDHPLISSALVGELIAQFYKRSEEHTSELQSRLHLVCRLLLEKKKNMLLMPRLFPHAPVYYQQPHPDHDRPVGHGERRPPSRL